MYRFLHFLHHIISVIILLLTPYQSNSFLLWSINVFIHSEKGINFEKGMEKWFANTKGARNYDLTEHMVDAVWGLHRRWTTIATKRRKSLNFFQHFAVFLVGTGAILQTLSHSLAPPYEWITSLAAGGFLGVAPFITQHFLSHEKMTAWIVSRATAEALKAEVIKFRAGVRPFHGDDSVEALAMIASKILEPGTCKFKMMIVITFSSQSFFAFIN